MSLMVTLLFPKLLPDTLPFSCSSDVVEFPQIPQIFSVFAPDCCRSLGSTGGHKLASSSLTLSERPQ